MSHRPLSLAKRVGLPRVQRALEQGVSEGNPSPILGGEEDPGSIGEEVVEGLIPGLRKERKPCPVGEDSHHVRAGGSVLYPTLREGGREGVNVHVQDARPEGQRVVGFEGGLAEGVIQDQEKVPN